MKAAFLLLALAACEHAEPTDKKSPPPPDKPDPVKQARAEFELLPQSAAVGTSKLYSRGDFLPDSAELTAGFDEGDFIGRLRTLFGPRDGDEYVFRQKATGQVITAYSGDSGPSYGGTADMAGSEARRAADPLLKQQMPMPDVNNMHAYRTFMHHLDAAIAGPAATAAVTRLDALVSMVPPADFSETKYYEDEPSVYRFGAKGGQSFTEDVPAAEGMTFLLDRANTATGYESDTAIISFYLAHTDELAAEKPKALAALSHLATVAKQTDDAELRELLEGQVKDFRAQLR